MAKPWCFWITVAGPDNGYLLQTLNLLRQPQVFDGLPTAPSFGHRLLLLLQMLAPAKYQALGDEPLRALVRTGYEAAKRHGFTTEPGMMNYITLAYVLGIGFDRDPVYPWAAATLSDPALANPAQRSAALRETALAHLFLNVRPVVPGGLNKALLRWKRPPNPGGKSLRTECG